MQVYFAPLESITGYVFRNVYEAYYGGIDRYFTPFITATDSRRLRNLICRYRQKKRAKK